MVWRCIAISSSYIYVKILIIQSALIGNRHVHHLLEFNFPAVNF